MMELLLARMNASMKEHMQEMKAERMLADRKSDREQMLAEISARMDANTKELNAKMDANQAEMRSTVCAIRSELEETIQHEMKGVLLYVNQKTQNLRMELMETIENSDGIIDSRGVPRQTDTGRQGKNSINHGGYYL
jgi:hypothetical protein